MRVKLLHPGARLPERMTVGSGGYDLFLPDDVAVVPSSRPQKIPLGIAIEIPFGCVGIIKARSSVENLLILDGVIDSDYRGELYLRALNINRNDRNIVYLSRCSRVAQLLVFPCYQEPIEAIDLLSQTGRAGGFGSTGR